ncbi:MAG: SusC/RagA family TonB-linked outer membrane protein, partial [Bacteroidetes bacterium]
MKKTLLVVSMVFFAIGITFAQRSISGSVTDDNGEPLIGASVLVKGTSTGTITDFDGKYILSVPEGREVLVFSFTGFDPQEITLGASNVIDVVLSEGVTLQTAVVTALGIEKEEKTLGYGVTQVDGDDVTRTRNNSFVDALSGKVSGLTVNTNSQPGGSSEIVIRGYGSVTGNNQALVVIDGVPASNGNNTSITTLLNPLDDFNRSQDFGNQVNDINPDDIESISVLKGAAATALYGSRAANGAIIITTKSGKRNQKVTVDYSGSYTRTQVNRLPHMQNTFGQGWNGLFDSIENGSWGPKTDDQL